MINNPGCDFYTWYKKNDTVVCPPSSEIDITSTDGNKTSIFGPLKNGRIVINCPDTQKFEKLGSSGGFACVNNTN